MAELQIKITRIAPAYAWEPLALTRAQLTAAARQTAVEPAPDDGCLLLFTRTAWREIADFIRWGDRETKVNRVEQGGMMAGSHYRLTGADARVCLVRHVFPLYTATGSGGYLNAEAADWNAAYAAMDRRVAETGETLDVIGWFHTHPNSLPVFMSGTDHYTQERVFHDEYNYAVVLNPHTRVWKAFRGRDAHPACAMLLDADDLPTPGSTPAPESFVRPSRGRRRWRAIQAARRIVRRAGR